MSAPDPVVHIAIPCRGLDEAVAFYGELLGCRIGRRHADHVLVDFYGHQLVCHVSPDGIDPEPRMYPRHFGVAFRTREAWQELLDRMRAKDAPRLAVLRSMRAAFQTELKREGAETLSDDACVAVLRRLAKQRKESIDAFEQAGRADRAAEERAELEVIETFLPSLADESQTRSWVEAAIAETGASAPGDVGRVMGALMKAHKGDVDGLLAKKLVAELLGD